MGEQFNITGITNYSFTGGAVNGTHGYLLQPNWTYNSSPYLSADYTTWATGALSDFNGKSNSAELEKDVSDEYIGKVLVDFKADNSKNLNKSDWYVPACGQLALICINKNDINTVISAIGGEPFSKDDNRTYVYWSSSEVDANNAWQIRLEIGMVSMEQGYKMKGTKANVIFIRDIE